MDSMYLPTWTIGPDCYNDVYDVVKGFGKKVAVIGGKTAMSKAVPYLVEAIKDTDLELTDPIVYGDDATFEHVDRLKAMPEVQAADMIFAFGGGKAMDTCKALAYQTGKPIFTFPTVCSNCASATTTCIMYYPDHTMREMYYPKHCANHVFINTKVIAESPDRFMWAGIGDALAKEYETEQVSRGEFETVEMTHSPYLGITIAQACTQPLLKYGKKTMESMEKGEASYELEQAALAVIISAALASILNADPLDRFYYNTCIAHCFYNSYTVTSKAHEHLHGEVVSLGILIGLAYDKNIEELHKLFAFYKSMGLPMTMDAVDLAADEVKALVDKAMTVVEWPHIPGVTEENFTAAIFEEDRLAKEWLAANA